MSNYQYIMLYYLFISIIYLSLLFIYCKGMQKSLEHFYFKFTLIFYTLGVLL